MPLIVETGTGATDAESYASVAAADAYHAGLGNEAWADLELAQKEQYLRRATRFLVSQYRGRWKGYRAYTMQALDWPRSGVWIDDANEFVMHNLVPKVMVDVTAELALKASTGALLEDQTQRVLSESLGPLSVNYDPNSPQGVRYLEIDGLLAPYLKGSSSMLSLERA